MNTYTLILIFTICFIFADFIPDSWKEHKAVGSFFSILCLLIGVLVYRSAL